MTADKDLKRLVRGRAARTGESYAAARRAIVGRVPRETGSTGRTFDLWFSRATQGYSGKGAKPTGFEHHVITVAAAGVVVEAEIAFANFGIHRSRVSSDGQSLRSSFTYAEVVRVDGSLAVGGWRCRADDGDGTDVVVAVPSEAAVVPSVAARFLPLTLPLEQGELARYVPVPEDAFPAWRPRGIGSWFPLMGASRQSLVEERIVIGRGAENKRIGRRTFDLFRVDHVAVTGEVRATTWFSDDGALFGYEQAGCVLRAVDEEEARGLDPQPRPGTGHE